MIYIENKDGVQRVVIPTNDTNVEYVNFVPQEGDSNYYTKTQTDEKITQSRTAVLGEVGDWLSHYPTTDQMHDAIEEAVKDLEPGDDTAEYATLDDLRGLANIVNNNDMKLSQTMLVTTSGEDMCETNLVTGPSGTYIPFKTVNGESIVGHGDVEVGAGGGIEPVIVEVDSFEPITKTAFDQLFESYNQGIPSYIRKSGLPEQLIPVVGIQGNITGTIMPVAKMWVIVNNNLIEYTRSIGPNIGYTTIPLGGSADMSDYYTKGEVDTVKDDLQEQITDIDSRVKDIELNGGGSGGASGAKVYVAEWDDASGGYTRVTNQMVYDMFKDYSNGLTVQLKYNDMLLTVYFAKQEAPYCYVYILAANIMGEFAGDINLPSDTAAYSEYPLITREIFDKEMPHKYDYTITDDIALTGYFSQGEGYELFNDVRDGADINFKLIMNEGQRKYIPFSFEYDRRMDKVNFMFLDYGRYISCTLESNGNLGIGTENFN